MSSSFPTFSPLVNSPRRSRGASCRLSPLAEWSSSLAYCTCLSGLAGRLGWPHSNWAEMESLLQHSHYASARFLSRLLAQSDLAPTKWNRQNYLADKTKRKSAHTRKFCKLSNSANSPNCANSPPIFQNCSLGFSPNNRAHTLAVSWTT